MSCPGRCLCSNKCPFIKPNAKFYNCPYPATVKKFCLKIPGISSEFIDNFLSYPADIQTDQLRKLKT